MERERKCEKKGNKIDIMHGRIKMQSRNAHQHMSQHNEDIENNEEQAGKK
jgi:hypothetical protein